MRFIVLLCFVLFSCFVHGHDGPHMTNSSIWFTESLVLDVEYDVAVAQLTFDQDLYFNEPYLCSGADQACVPFSEQPCLPCDWSDHDPNPPIDCGHSMCCGPAQVGGEPYARVNDWCDPSLKYTTLRVGQPSQRYFLNTGELMYFRFFISEKYYCRPFNVAVRPDYGTANMYISQLWAQPDANHSSAARITSESSFGQTIITECPNVHSLTDLGIPHVGTYALTVQAVVPTTFYVEVGVSPQLYPLPAPANPVSCSSVPHWEYDYAGVQNPGQMVMCLPDTKTVNVSLNSSMVGEYVQLILPVSKGCYTLQVAVNMLTFGTDVDLYCLPPDAKSPVTKDNSLIARWWTGDDHIVINACFDQVRYLHCGAQVWKPGNVSFIWSTTSVANLLWIENVSSGVFSMQHTGAMGTLVLGKPSSSCVDTYSNCYNWLTPSLNDPLVFWPPPSNVNRPTSIFNPTPLELVVKAGLSKKLNRTLTFVSALSVEGQVLYSNTSIFFQQATFAILSITNSRGVPIDLPMNGVDNNNRGDLRFYVPNIAASSLRNVSDIEQCQYVRYNKLQKIIDDEMALSTQSTNLSDMLLHKYNLDTLSASFTHVACLRQAKKGLTVLQNQSIVRYNTYECAYDPAVNYDLWSADPCCNVNLRAVSCCGPRSVTTVTPLYGTPNSSFVSSHSGLPGCSTSYFNDVGKALNNLDDPLRGCESGIADYTAAIAASIEAEFEKTVRYCQVVVGLGTNFQGVSCALDTDCSSLGTLCNMKTQKCFLPPLQTVETNYLSCFLTQMSASTEDYIRTKVLSNPMWDYGRSDPIFLAAVQAAAAAPDCVMPSDPLDITYRSKYVYDAGSSSCKDNVIAASGVDASDCSPQTCLGTSCRVPPSQCFKLCYPSYTFKPSSQATCPTTTYRCSVEGSAPCLGEGVCAYCGDGSAGGGQRCQLAPGNFNQVTCPLNTVCAFPNGTTAFGMSPYDCIYQTEPYGSCSVDCPGKSCRSYLKSSGVCWAPSISNADDCQNLQDSYKTNWNVSMSTEWTLNSICVVKGVSDSATCLSYNSYSSGTVQFDTCGGYSLSQCNGSTPVQYLMQCFVDNWSTCKNRIECQTYGTCSDRKWTTRPVTDSVNQKFSVQFGACFSSGFTDYSQKEPYCYSTMDRPGIGCRELALNSSDKCIPFQVNDANEWWWRTWLTPAMTQYDCEAQTTGRYGCLIPGIEQNLRWLSPADCACAGGTMKNAFKWTPGVWNSGVVRQLQWTNAVATPNYVWSNTSLSFPIVESWVRGSAQVKYLNSGKSEVLCSNNMIKQPLDALVCDGLSSNTPAMRATCYTSSFRSISFLVAVGTACAGDAVTVKAPFANISFAKNSVLNGCVGANLSAVSYEWFRQLRGSRGSTFSLNYFGRRAWVQNNYGTDVGIVAGDGINITLSNVANINSFTVCLGVTTPQNNSYYTARDFGILHGLNVMVPLNVSISVTKYDSSEMWCTQMSHPQQSMIVVPIYRIPNAFTLNHEHRTSHLMYALNAMYFVCFLLIVFALFLIGKFFEVSSWILISFFCLCIFRIVFTLMYPLGAMTNTTHMHQLIGEYITFETPSFLYATAAFLTLKFAIPSVTYQTIGIAVFSVWMLWVVAVTIFSEVVLDVPNSFEQCPGRGREEDEAIRHNSMHLSVAWHAVLFFWSMVLIFYVRSNQPVGGSSFRYYFQSLILYLFWVHEILFIIILADDMTSSVYVFVTLLITETFMMIGLCVLVIMAPFEFDDPQSEGGAAPVEGKKEGASVDKKEEAHPAAAGEGGADLPPSSVSDRAPMMEEIPV